jgi:PiT family inorganic phosphate transporter
VALSNVALFTIGLALIFNLLNGFHDAANSIATVVSTRVLSPRTAVLWAAFFNFAAMFVFAPKVAKTISGTIHIDAHDPVFIYVILSGLLGAIIWNLLTWWWALPTSSTHALIGGLGGAGIAYGGFDILVMEKIRLQVIFIFVAPVVGFIVGFVLMLALYWLLRRWRPGQVDDRFRIGQLLSAASYSLGHGGNDAQKTMGVIIAVLITEGQMTQDYHHIPWWIVTVSNVAMGLGTAFGGWRIVKTMGMKITKLRPVGGFCAEVAGAATLFGATWLAVPVSTTHTITGAIIGVGATRKLTGIKWGVAQRIVWAWVLTIPAAATVGALVFLSLRSLGVF